MHVLNIIIGCLNIAIFLTISIFMIRSCLKKSKFSRINWFGFWNLVFSTGVVASGQISFSKIESKNCNFGLDMIYGAENIILFNLSMLIGYKTYCICHEVNEFSIKGSLPGEREKKIKKYIVTSMWTFSIIYMLVFLFLGFYF